MRLTTSAAIWLASERANPMLLGCVGGSVPPLANCVWCQMHGIEPAT